MRSARSLALGAAAMFMAVFAARAAGDDSATGGGGLDIVFPPDGHVFRHDEDVQLALLFAAESAEVRVRASSAQRATPGRTTLSGTRFWLALLAALPGAPKPII